jgi:hypothetical protein
MGCIILHDTAHFYFILFYHCRYPKAVVTLNLFQDLALAIQNMPKSDPEINSG